MNPGSKTRDTWLGHGDQVWPVQTYKLKLKGLYMYSGGFYTYSILVLIFWETRLSDFGVSMGHHVATLILIVLSYIFRFARVGSVVLALHDASDAFIEVVKMSVYSGAETLASFSFVLFVLSWVVLRLIYYLFWILWSTSYEFLLTLDKEKHKSDVPIYYYIFNFLLFSLLVLHIYWCSECCSSKNKKEAKSKKILGLILKMKMSMKIEEKEAVYIQCRNHDSMHDPSHPQH